MRGKARSMAEVPAVVLMGGICGNAKSAPPREPLDLPLQAGVPSLIVQFMPYVPLSSNV
jgi:hypothetical protein